MDKLTIVYASDHRLYQWLPMSINSVLTHNPDCHIYVFCEDDKIEQLNDSRITILNINNYPDYDVHWTYRTYELSKLTFVRLWMADVLQESKVIWLDVDTIVTGSLEPLWNTYLGFKVIGGVFDAYQYCLGNGSLYMNAGVMLMDLDKWRALRMGERVHDTLRHKYYRCADQDVLNDVCQQYIKYLDLKWNYQLCQPMQIKLKDAVIYHYAAHPKLWENEQVQQWAKYYTPSINEEIK